MGYRFLLAVIFLSLMAGCAAFDHGSTPYEGFDPSEVKIPNGLSGPYNGKFTGTMTPDSNTCASVSDEVGAAVPLDVQVVQKDKLINMTFSDQQMAPGELSPEGKGTFMVEISGTKHVYYLTFSEDSKIEGTSEVIEKDENGTYAKPCATYTVALSKSAESS